MSRSHWDTMDEFEQDLYSISAVDKKDFERVPPPSILQYKARMQKNYSSVYDSEQFEEDRIMSGRGKNRPNIVLRPGEKVQRDDMMDESIHKIIRETSGLGYSNEVINHLAKFETTKEKVEPINKLVQLQPTKKTIMRTSPGYASSLSKKSSCSSSRSSTPNESPRKKKEDTKPPPLSEMMKKAKEDLKQKKATQNQFYWAHMSNITPGININSEDEFPALK